MSVDVVLDAAAELGESPLWDPDAERLLWLDLLAGALHALDPATGADALVLAAGEPLCAVGLRRCGGYVLALERSFAVLDPAGTLTRVADGLPADAGVRFNDGAVDPEGHFWSGSMSYDGTPGRGALVRLDPDGTTTTALTGLSLSNGLVWTPDGRTLYHVDTATRGIDAYEAAPDGTLHGRRRVVSIPDGAGDPDGLALDADGGLWVALWNGSAVRRYAPDGTLLRTVPVPVSRPTSCCIVEGTLYITSAAYGLTAEQRRREPHAGAVLAADAGVGAALALRYAG